MRQDWRRDVSLYISLMVERGKENFMKFVIEHLSKHFEKKEVLRDIDFTFESGRIYGLLGRNGAGKTTLFNCLNRDIKADGGRFYLLDDAGEREVRPEDIGYVLSTPTVPEFLTGREFLKFFLDINGDSIENPKTLDEYFDYMSIDPEDRDKLLKDYSHGMKNKMQMLINIIAQPEILLLDEPLTSLDVVVAEEMKQLLRSLKSGRITIFSTHIMDLALDLCDEIVLLNRGELEIVDKSNLDDRGFKEKIIAALRDDDGRGTNSERRREPRDANGQGQEEPRKANGQGLEEPREVMQKEGTKYE